MPDPKLEGSGPCRTFGADTNGDSIGARAGDQTGQISFTGGSRTVHELVVRVRVAAAALFKGTGTAWKVDACADLLSMEIGASEATHVCAHITEALRNVQRGGSSTQASVRIFLESGRLGFEVDDGRITTDAMPRSGGS